MREVYSFFCLNSFWWMRMDAERANMGDCDMMTDELLRRAELMVSS